MSEYIHVTHKVTGETGRAVQWFKNGDHPEDNCIVIQGEGVESFLTEGQFVRYYRVPGLFGRCPQCLAPYDDHGWIDTARIAGLWPRSVCPGNWIIDLGGYGRMVRVLNHADFLDRYTLTQEGKTNEPQKER